MNFHKFWVKIKSNRYSYSREIEKYKLLLLYSNILKNVWLQNRVISAGLEPVFSQTEKSCIASYYSNFPRILE